MNTFILVAVPVLAVVALLAGAEAQSSLGPRRSAGADPAAEPSTNKKDKRGLLGLGAVVGYDPYSAPGLPVAYDAYGAYGGYGAYKTPVPVPYPAGYAGYAVPVAKVAYGPGPAYGAYTDGLYSRLGAYAPFGAYGPHGYAAPATYPAAYPAGAGVVAAPLVAAGYKAYAY